jgi:hypothetical protein
MSVAAKPSLFVVTIALLWVALAFSLIRVVADTDHVVIPAPFALVYGLFVLVFVVKAFFIYKISKLRNWARIVYLSVIALGSIRVVPDLIAEIAKAPTLGLVELIAVALQVVAICLLFIPPCNELFKKPIQLV